MFDKKITREKIENFLEYPGELSTEDKELIRRVISSVPDLIEVYKSTRDAIWNRCMGSEFKRGPWKSVIENINKLEEF